MPTTDSSTPNQLAFAFETEIWGDVLGFEGLYAVSNHGRVRSLVGRRPKPDQAPRILSPGRVRGYLQVSLSKGRKVFQRKVHQLVLEAFCDKPPQGLIPNHKNGKKDDNRLANLEWMTHSENTKHAYRIGLLGPVQGERHGRSKLTEQDVKAIRELLKKGRTLRSIGKMFGVCGQAILNIRTGKHWSHLH